MALRKRTNLHRAGALSDKKPAPDRRRHGVSISPEAYRALERYCNERKLSQASVVEELIRRHCGATDTRSRRQPPGWHGVVTLDGEGDGRGNGRSDFLERGSGPVSKLVDTRA